MLMWKTKSNKFQLPHFMNVFKRYKCKPSCKYVQNICIIQEHFCQISLENNLARHQSSVMALIGQGSQQCWAYAFHQLFATKFLAAKQVILNGTNGTNATNAWLAWFYPGANQQGHRNILTNSIWLHHRRFPPKFYNQLYLFILLE